MSAADTVAVAWLLGLGVNLAVLWLVGRRMRREARSTQAWLDAERASLERDRSAFAEMLERERARVTHNQEEVRTLEAGRAVAIEQRDGARRALEEKERRWAAERRELVEDLAVMREDRAEALKQRDAGLHAASAARSESYTARRDVEVCKRDHGNLAMALDVARRERLAAIEERHAADSAKRRLEGELAASKAREAPPVHALCPYCARRTPLPRTEPDPGHRS